MFNNPFSTDKELSEMDISLCAPLMLSEFFFENATILRKHGDDCGAIAEMKKVRDPAFAAFSRAVLRPGPKTEISKEASWAQQLVILSQITINSYDTDSSKILPFAQLASEKKSLIKNLIGYPVSLLLRFHDPEAEKGDRGKEKRQQIVESLLEKDFADFGEEGLLHNLLVGAA